MKSKEEIADKLSQAIFGKSWNHLTLDEKQFTYLHIRWFSAYRKQIAAAARAAMGSKKLDGKDYWLILDWYLNRVPPSDVLAAISECLQWAKNNSKAIFSLNYFRKAVTRHFEKTLQSSPPRAQCDGDDPYWHYQSYILWTQGRWPGWYFDPFEGPNPHYGINNGKCNR